MHTIKGILCDLEGVLYQGESLIEGALDAIHNIQSAGYQIRFLTNTSTRSSHLIKDKLTHFGFDVDADQIVSPGSVAAHYLQEKKSEKVYLLAPDALHADFSAFNLTDEHPDAIVVGDLYHGFTWDHLNHAFQCLMSKPTVFVALHKNRYCMRSEEGLSLDLGPFIHALEYAANQSAFIVGKPEKEFFELALTQMGLSFSSVVMVGDDLYSDIGGALAANISAIQVQTGKFQPSDCENKHIVPTKRINSIADLLSALSEPL